MQTKLIFLFSDASSQVKSTLCTFTRVNTSMNIDKLAFTLWYYYDNFMLRKVPGKENTYEFTWDISEMLGYDPVHGTPVSDPVRRNATPVSSPANGPPVQNQAHGSPLSYPLHDSDPMN